MSPSQLPTIRPASLTPATHSSRSLDTLGGYASTRCRKIRGELGSGAGRYLRQDSVFSRRKNRKSSVKAEIASRWCVCLCQFGTSTPSA